MKQSLDLVVKAVAIARVRGSRFGYTRSKGATRDRGTAHRRQTGQQSTPSQLAHAFAFSRQSGINGESGHKN
ncbi:hypothetical protein [Streptomyces sp. G45]|uniref:hypothetical protein n=1 Tax=Streptomyces sp. G45 TaxID=3406627 RepID=UPI003C19E35D